MKSSTAESVNFLYMHNILYKTEKSLKMKRDVGMACQKVHKQGRI